MSQVAVPIPVDLVAGSPAELHQQVVDLSTTRIIVCRPTSVAWVLGSAQPDASVDRAAAHALGIEVVRRRSGGGGVLIRPGEMVWIDIVLSRSHPLWSDDVGQSMWWVGDAWSEALWQLDVGNEVHRGSLIRTPWSPLVCFAGVGAGEVLTADEEVTSSAPSKLVGISQRRTRDGARLQTMCHLRWRPQEQVALVAEAARPSGTFPTDAAATVPVRWAADAVERAAVGALASRLNIE
jgi:lipoate---protein ligase